MDTYTFIVMLHVIGTILGTGGATIAEVQITRALRDKTVSAEEKALMHVNYFLIRVGMGILLVSVLGMYWYLGLETLLSSDKLLIKDVMFAAIFINALALQKRWVPLWLGASTSFVSWWGATLLGLAGQLPYSFVTYLIGYVAAIFAFAGVSKLLRGAYERGQLGSTRVALAVAALLLVVAIALYAATHKNEHEEAAQRNGTAATDAPVSREPSGAEAEGVDTRTLSEVVYFEYPGGEHNVQIDITLDDENRITDVNLADIDPDNQGRFAEFTETIREEVVGLPLSEAAPRSRVGGASLTTEAWNEAVATMHAAVAG